VSVWKACAVIPTHNHVTALAAILTRLGEAGLPTIVIDDGSDPAIGNQIRAICEAHTAVEYLRQDVNGGKGAAVLQGLIRAQEHGYTHAVQIDADGQHDLDSLPALLATARNNPTAIVSGAPQFDGSMPMARRIGRPITSFWVSINAVSRQIKDAMCGFRVYPVATTVNLIQKSVRGQHMDFDVEVLVKAHWAGIAIAMVPVRVHYPDNNFSNFRALRDNLAMSRLHTRLFFGMLVRLPRLAFRRRPMLNLPDSPPSGWASMRERGAYWGLSLLGTVYWIFGRWVCLTAMSPVILYFFLTGRTQRTASHEYLMHMWQCGYLPKRPTALTSLRHFLSFGASSLDKLAAWSGRIPQVELDGTAAALLAEAETGMRGAFIVTAHIGNPEVIRAIATLSRQVRVTVLMHTEHAELFNRLIQKFSPHSSTRVMQVTKIGPAEAIVFSEAIKRGGWLVIAGDRVPVSADGRTIDVPFLGDLAPFPQGPYILGAILKAPAFLMFCVREAGRYRVYFSRFADPIELPRTNRLDAIRRYASAYAKVLEERVARAPLQWFNFYPFWAARHDQVPLQKAAE
jgi:predicted LPLAT superfamily acyltransferase